MESKAYYYLNGTVKVGPLSLEALKYAPIYPSTMVWNNSLPDWVEARALPELAEKFAVMAPPPPVPSGSNQMYGNMQGGYYAGPAVRPPMPDNYLIWAIMTTICCCMPLGIVSIIYSSKVGPAYAMGDYAGAQKASNDAKKWAMWSAIVIGILVLLYIIVIAILVAAGVMNDL